jgi:hypothetical protein
MGHLHFKKQCKIFLDFLAKKAASLGEIIEKSEKIPVSCSEGNYTDLYMIQQCFETVASCYREEGVVEPLIKTKKQRAAWKRMDEGGIDDIDDPMLKDYHSIKWKFRRGKKAAYKRGEIPVFSSITL